MERKYESHERLSWGSVYKRVVLYGLSRHRLKPAAAQRVTQEAIAIALIVGPGDPRILLQAVARPPKKRSRPITPVEQLEALMTLFDDMLDPGYPEHLVDDELRDRGLDPEALDAEGEAFVRGLRAKPS